MKDKLIYLFFLIFSGFPFFAYSQTPLSDSARKSPLNYLGMNGIKESLSIQKVISVNETSLFPLILTKKSRCLIYMSEYKTKDSPVEKKDVLYFCWDKEKNHHEQGSLLLNDSMESLYKIKDPEEFFFITINQDVFMASEIDQGKIKFSKQNINTKYYEGNACVSPDGNSLYFVSNRDGGYGGKDIYGCEKLSDGNWSTPYNLGSKINTPVDEESPFLLADGVTLFFSSKGHDSFGGFDIFTSTLSDEGYWSEPENIGYHINTTFDELNYVSDEYGTFGYFSSNKDSYKYFDVYFINY